MYLTRGEQSLQYAIVHTTNKSKACSIQGHSRACEHMRHISTHAHHLGELLLPESDEEKYDFFLADYEREPIEEEGELGPELITEEGVLN